MERAYRWPRLAHTSIYYPRSSRGGPLAKGKQHAALKHQKKKPAPEDTGAGKVYHSFLTSASSNSRNLSHLCC